MKSLACLFALSCGLGAITVLAESPKADTTAASTTQLAWEGAALVYKGKPVHPMAIYEFAGLLSSGTAWYELYLDGAFSIDRYPQKVNRLPDGSILCEQDDADPGKGYVLYHVLGRLRGGTYVLMCSRNGGGSGVFQDLLFVRSFVQKIKGVNGRMTSRSMLQLVDSYGIGDRYGGKIQVREDRIIVGPYGQDIKQELVLHEPQVVTEP